VVLLTNEKKRIGIAVVLHKMKIPVELFKIYLKEVNTDILNYTNIEILNSIIPDKKATNSVLAYTDRYKELT
jgi:hypothetical protein